MSAVQTMAASLLAPYPPVAIHEREEETQDPEDVTHARGFPGLGPPTLCGEGEAPKDVPTVVTCPACVALSHDVQALANRAEQLQSGGTR